MEAADIWQGWGRPDRHPHLGLLLLFLSFLPFRGWYSISSLWHRLCLPRSHCHWREMCLYRVISQPCCFSHGSHQGTGFWKGQVSSAHILSTHGQRLLCFPFKNSAVGDCFSEHRIGNGDCFSLVYLPDGEYHNPCRPSLVLDLCYEGRAVSELVSPKKINPTLS